MSDVCLCSYDKESVAEWFRTTVAVYIVMYNEKDAG